MLSVQVQVIVTPDIAISAQPVGGSICTGGNFDLSVTASGSPDIHYQWQSYNGTTWSNVGTDSPANIKSKDDIVHIMRKPGPGMTTFDENAVPEKSAKEIAGYILKTFK